ncbi:MAG: hypothetical protein RBR84_09365 [Bacteroidales bacterium]|jgi:OOP family OmpA-OmpF porin|nr:hypothetical protein [Bacteroidales bacterium]
MKEKDQTNTTEKLSADQLQELRELVTGLDKLSLQRMQKLMADPHEFAIEISELLPFSIRKLIEKGSINMADLLPFFEDMIQESIEKNPQRLANLLFPIMGPAIRKAVSEDLKRLIDSLNQGLESGLSPKHLKWRFQALFSSKSYVEIMLSHAYLYQVKHVFLIHRDTALLLHHEKAEHVLDIEADMIASMLSAITDFAKDSFHSDEQDAVDSIKIGDTNLWVEQGPHAIIAAVVEGNPPPDLRIELKEALEAVHYNHRPELLNFEGETEIFEHTSKFLKPCLIKEKKEKGKKTPLFALMLLVIVLIGLGFWIYQSIQTHHTYAAATELFSSESGYYLTKTERQNGKLRIFGLKDDYAIEPSKLLESKQLSADQFEFVLRPFVSMDSMIIIRRAEAILTPPETVSFAFEKGILQVSGHCKAEWKVSLEQHFNKVWGVHSLDTNQLTITDKPVRDLSWIIGDIMKYKFVFDVNVLEMTEDQSDQFYKLTQTANLLDEFNRLNNKQYKILVQSVTSKAGNEAANLRIATMRAQTFLELLKEAGVPKNLLETRVINTEELVEPEEVRSVSFVVEEK